MFYEDIYLVYYTLLNGINVLLKSNVCGFNNKYSISNLTERI